MWCVEYCGVAIGFTRLVPPSFRDGVEIGWRIKSEHWGNGFAPEAARSCLRFAFQTLGLEDVVSFSAAINLKSQRVMEKIGMTRDDEADFGHPSVALGSPLRLHVLYRITAGHYREML